MTIALDKENLKKMTDMFNNQSTYSILNKNPIRKLINGFMSY